MMRFVVKCEMINPLFNPETIRWIVNDSRQTEQMDG